MIDKFPFFFFPVTISSYYRESDPVLKAKKKVDVMTRVIPFYLNKLEELAKNNGGYLHGDKVSVLFIIIVYWL